MLITVSLITNDKKHLVSALTFPVNVTSCPLSLNVINQFLNDYLYLFSFYKKNVSFTFSAVLFLCLLIY